MINNQAEAYVPFPEDLGGLFSGDATDTEQWDDPFEDEPEEEILVADEVEQPAPTSTVVFRDYQSHARKAILNEFNHKVRSTLTVMATGTGKSVVIGDLVATLNEWGHGVLILVHRDELIRQLVKACARFGVATAVEKAEERALSVYRHGMIQTVVASKDSLRGNRLDAWPKDAFKVVVIDEAHHALMTNGYGAILRHFGLDEGRIRVAGFTATADRLDGENIGQVFETLAFEYNIQQATRDGWLVPVEAMQLRTDPQIDLRDLRITAGDFNQGDLERAVQENIGTLVNALVDTNALEDRRTIAFTPNIASARALAAALTDVGISAQAVAGADADREAKFKGHQRGDFQVLCNCAVATEGYDDPQISAVLICRPTKSRALYSQMVGRGTRLHPESGKNSCRVVDFAFITGKHKLVSPVDLYDNRDEPDEVIETAREILASGRATSLDEAMEEAHEKFETERKVRIQRRMVSVKASRFDPLDACDLFDVPRKDNYQFGEVVPASHAQVEALKKMGVEATAAMGKDAASRLMKKLIARREHGWASPWQIRDLIRSGMDAETAKKMRFQDAKAHLDANPLGPSDAQKFFLKRHGYSDADLANMTKRSASELIGSLKGSQGA